MGLEGVIKKASIIKIVSKIIKEIILVFLMLFMIFAEPEGFEPSRPVKACLFSKEVRSTTPPRFQCEVFLHKMSF